MSESHHNIFLFSLMVNDLKFNLLFMNRLNCLPFMKHLVPRRTLSPMAN